MSTQEDLAAFAERLRARGREVAANRELRQSREHERLAGHSVCADKDAHCRAGCCPRIDCSCLGKPDLRDNHLQSQSLAE